MRRLLLAGVIGLFIVAAVVPVAIIAFSAPKSPPPMVSMGAPFKQISFEDLPAPRQFKARDGSSLEYYAYPAGSDEVAVLIHGSVGPGMTMHALAKSLRAAGVTIYVLDIRGHGGSGRRGDIDYIGQIDDDLADFVSQLGAARGGHLSVSLLGPDSQFGSLAAPMACCLIGTSFSPRSYRGANVTS